jgi:hypothetical protein
MSAPNSRPVHPCVLSVWEGTSGAEYSTWAKITKRASASSSLPDLVTAQGSTLTVYKMDEASGKLLCVHKFPSLAGNVCYLDTLKTSNGSKSGSESSDALVVGFCGHPRLAIVTVTPDLLLATTLLDLTPALQEYSYGAVTPLDQDLQASLTQSSATIATLCVVLGGGVVVACLELHHQDAEGWTVAEPYLLPLQQLSAKESTANVQSIMTGFGDVLSTTFLPGYLEPTLVVLHSNPAVGRACSGRLGRTEGGTRFGLQLTAITVTVSHERSAILWSTEVPADALEVYPAGAQGCLVHCANAMVAISNTGQVQQCLAVNGWVEATLPLSIQATANPWPFPKLSIALDGAVVSFLNDTTAFCILRCGQVYLLQYTNAWSLLPLYTTIGALGQVANVVCWPLGNVLPATLEAKLWDKAKSPSSSSSSSSAAMEMGLLFVGSRLGDSSLLGYALESSSVADALKQEPGLKAKVDGNGIVVKQEDDEYDRILQLEEDALYAPTGDQESEEPDVIPPSDDEENGSDQVQFTKRKRARLSHLVVVRSLTVLDSLTGFGPLGPACTGPLSKSSAEPVSIIDGTTSTTLGATGYIFPCGHGSSGGLALLTAPGRDDRTILAEKDCINAKALFSLPIRGLVLLGMSEGIRCLKLETTTSDVKAEGGGDTTDHCMSEVDLQEWATEETRNILETCDLLAACERNEESFALLIGSPLDDNSMSYSLLAMKDNTGTLEIQTNTPLSIPAGEFIRTATPFTRQESGQLMVGYTLSTGDAKLVTVDANGSVQEHMLQAQVPMDVEGKDPMTEEEQYYAVGNVVALDIFQAPEAFFASNSSPLESKIDDTSAKPSTNNGGGDEDYFMDGDDKELYAETGKSAETDDEPLVSSDDYTAVSLEEVWFVGLCRQSGVLEVYRAEDLVPGQEATPMWTSSGCGHGVPQLKSGPQEGSAYRAPRMHKVHTNELRFFFAGPSSSKLERSLIGPRPFCLAIETSDGDALLYSADIDARSMALKAFQRAPLKSPSRPSQEQSKHFSKLRRKGIVKDLDESQHGFCHNRLFRFIKLSGQDGLFAAVARPVWLIAERGKPAVLCHRSRHAAPAGAKPRSISGFCSGLLVSEIRWAHQICRLGSHANV